MNDTYGARLRAAREHLGLSKEEAARTATITVAELDALERGEAISGRGHSATGRESSLHTYTQGMFVIADSLEK